MKSLGVVFLGAIFLNPLMAEDSKWKRATEIRERFLEMGVKIRRNKAKRFRQNQQNKRSFVKRGSRLVDLYVKNYIHPRVNLISAEIRVGDSIWIDLLNETKKINKLWKKFAYPLAAGERHILDLKMTAQYKRQGQPFLDFGRFTSLSKEKELIIYSEQKSKKLLLELGPPSLFSSSLSVEIKSL